MTGKLLWYLFITICFMDTQEFYQNMKTLMTIHNIQYQGKYGLEVLTDVLDIPKEANFFGRIR